MSERTWITPANIISIAGIGIAAAVGVAVGNPSGQEFMCGVNEFFCADVEPVNVVAWGEAFDMDAWCLEHVYKPARAAEAAGEPPPPGDWSECVSDLSLDTATAFTRPLDVVAEGSTLELSVNLSFEYDPIRDPKPFTIRLQCGHMPAGSSSWDVAPCRFTSTSRGYGTSFPPSDLVEAGEFVRAGLEPSPSFVFASRWGLELAGYTDTYHLKPGRYRVTVKVADQPDRVARRDATFQFEVR
ncbi:hypothetical protein GC169_08640 [bacterium]|nr:hypothetical protein [bacterium]